MAIIHGRNVIIYQGTSGTTKAIAAAKSCQISYKCDVIEKASSTQQSAKEFLAGRTEWDVSIDHLVVSGSEYEGVLKVTQRVYLRVNINNVIMKGYAICTQADISAPVGGLCKGVARFKGDGALT